MVTKQGLGSLEKELDELKNVKRPKIVERLAYARSQGDLSENSDYQNAKDELEFMDGRIEELDGVLKEAVVVENNSNSDEVGVGTQVKVKMDGTENTFNIVGQWEADPSEQKISHTSPLGQALIGKKVGDKVEVKAPAGKITYTILEIN